MSGTSKLFAVAIVSAAMLSAPLTGASQRRSNRTAWPNKRGVNVATSSETIPAFPRALSGYRPTGNNDYWNHPFEMRSSTRIGEGNGWEPLYEFPFTMNHCSDGVWMIRWRSANPRVTRRERARVPSHWHDLRDQDGHIRLHAGYKLRRTDVQIRW
jgi:hypothetical protein